MLLFQKCSLPKLQATVWAVPKLSSGPHSEVGMAMHSNMPQSEQEKHAAGKKRLDGAGGGWDISDTKLFKFDSIMCRCVWHAVAVAE
jgi:hypothetical protein